MAPIINLRAPRAAPVRKIAVRLVRMWTRDTRGRMVCAWGYAPDAVTAGEDPLPRVRRNRFMILAYSSAAAA